MGEIHGHISTSRLVRELTDMVHSMDAEMRQAVDDLGDDSEVIYAGVALKKTGRMARGIKAHRAGDTVLVEAHVKNPKDGYDYVGVTRFGHRKAWITPKWNRAIASVVSTGRKRRQRAGAALRLNIGGTVLFRRRVPGFNPHGDWAERGWPRVERAADRASEQLGRRLIARFG